MQKSSSDEIKVAMSTHAIFAVALLRVSNDPVRHTTPRIISREVVVEVGYVYTGFYIQRLL